MRCLIPVYTVRNIGTQPRLYVLMNIKNYEQLLPVNQDFSNLTVSKINFQKL